MRGAPRRFDWDDAGRLRREGHSYAMIGQKLGVTARAVRLALNPTLREMDHLRTTAWSQGGVCPDCGGPAIRVSRNRQHRCRSCSAKAQVTSIQGETALCYTCHEWKPLDAFSGRSMPGRFVSTECRQCNTRRKARSRALNGDHERAVARARYHRKKLGKAS